MYIVMVEYDGQYYPYARYNKPENAEEIKKLLEEQRGSKVIIVKENDK